MKFKSLSNNFTEWEKLQFFSRPQDRFKLDWGSYYSTDFGNTFLPYVDQLKNTGLKIYDGANLFSGNSLLDNNILMIVPNGVFNLVLYTYPNDTVIAQKSNKLIPAPDELFAFIQLDEKDKIQIKFGFGKQFKSYLTEYFKKEKKAFDISGLESKIFETDKSAFNNYFSESVNHQNTLLYILSFLDVKIGAEFDDGTIRIKLLKERDTIVPFGVKSYSKNAKEAIKKQPENEHIRFEIDIRENGIEDIKIEVLKGKDIYNKYSSALIDINGKAANGLKVYPVGKYYFEWDGFDQGDIYDSTVLTNHDFKLRVITVNKGILKNTESKEFVFKHQEVKWVDVKIDRIAKRADFHLRIDIRDGGEKGTQVDCTNSGTDCPWHEIAPIAIANEGFPAIQTRTQSYVDLKNAALVGIGKFWGRNSTNIGKGVTVAGNNYEVYVTSEVSEKGLKAPKIVYITNDDKEGRSRNFFLSRILFYNVGYFYYSKWQKLAYNNSIGAKRVYNNQGWYYVPENIADFEMTAAHEIGHEILLAYGGANYSFSHKDSSTVITQTVINNPLPKYGEIDLMQYYNDYYDITRTVAAQADVLGFFWLTKLQAI